MEIAEVLFCPKCDSNSLVTEEVREIQEVYTRCVNPFCNYIEGGTEFNN